VTLLPLCEWLAGTSGSIALRESLFTYPLVESAHVLTLCVFLGTAVMLDLRLLGLTLVRVPMSEIERRLGPWMVAGFVVMVITGVLLFYAIPVRSYQSIFFRAKVVTLVLAGLIAASPSGIAIPFRRARRGERAPGRSCSGRSSWSQAG
jgi:hypothetical protein